MTIIAVAVHRDFALIAADTEAILPGHGRLATTKIFALPHIRAAVTGRGELPFIAAVANAALFASGVDDLLAGLPALLLETRAKANELRAYLGAAPTIGPQQIVLAGLSARRGRFVGCEFTASTADGEFAAREFLDQTLFAPADGRPEFQNHLRNVAEMVDMARLQHALMGEIDPDAACGGELLVAHLVRDGLSIGATHTFAEERAAQ